MDRGEWIHFCGGCLQTITALFGLIVFRDARAGMLGLGCSGWDARLAMIVLRCSGVFEVLQQNCFETVQKPFKLGDFRRSNLMDLLH
jgi:hypothetical protein